MSLNWYKMSQKNPEGVYDKELNIPIPETCIKILQNLRNDGHLSLVVGGAVRDAVLGIPSKDIDIEVYGTSYEDLVKKLSPYGKVNLVGKSFGIVKLTDADGNDYDFSIPRRDSKVESDPSQVGERGGNRGRGISAEFDINISPKEAASRRDFTFNSIAYDPLNREIHDYFGGLDDIDNKIMRATSEQFSEDPLRVLRGMQFAARLGFELEPETSEMARSLKDEPLVKERVSEEWMKLFTKGKYPSKGLQYLIDTGWIDNYPELKAIVDVPQDPEWHPEGTVDAHTGYVMDAAAQIADREGLKGDDRAVIVAAALGHDLGKATTTKEEEKKGLMRVTSPGHAEISGDLTRSLLGRMGIKKDIIDRAAPLAEFHMSHIDYDPSSKKLNVRQIADKIYPASIKDLLYVIESDHSGRPPLEGGLPSKAQEMGGHAEEQNAYTGKVPPLILGRDIMYMFEQPGPLIGETLNHVRNKQLSGLINTQDEALIAAENYVKNKVLPISGKDVIEVTGMPGGPAIGEILDQAWRAYLNGETIDRDWISNNTVTNGQEEREINSMYSSRNMNYKKAKKNNTEEIDRILTLEGNQFLDMRSAEKELYIPEKSYLDYSQLKKTWGKSADVALNYVMEFEPGILDNIVYIGITDNPEIAGVFEPDLSDKIKGYEDGERQGVAFRLSPEKIESEAKKLSNGNEEILDMVREVVIAEIIVHEATHANGADGEQVPVKEEREFLKKVLNRLNENLKENGKDPLPLELK